MLIRTLIVAAAPTVAHSVRRWIYHLGALGFIPLGLIDSSGVHFPGSMDVLTIVLAARHEELWIYYAVMATVGSCAGRVRHVQTGTQRRGESARAEIFRK